MKKFTEFPVYVDRYGNTSSASIPIAFCDAVAEGRIKRGDKVCLVGFGTPAELPRREGIRAA